MDDFQLLAEYASAGSQAAFAQLVARHIDMVYAVCLRRLRDSAEAEDATQYVFISLAQKARAVRQGTLVAGWLFLRSPLNRLWSNLRSRLALSSQRKSVK